MRCGVVVFPGSNCDHDVYHVLKHVLDEEVFFLWHGEADLKECELIVLPGGFSYGDHLRAGAMAAHSPIMAAVQRHAAQGGMVLGICNGFQMLLEAGLLPGALMQWRDPTWNEVGWLALTAAFATAGHYTLTRAFRAAPLTVTQPIGFLQLVWAALMGVLIFGEAVDPFVFIGGGVVVAAATYISHREASAARRTRTPPAVATKF